MCVFVGIVFTILGVVVLDFCCDGCQTPCRTLMIDLSNIGDQSQGLAIFTVTAGIGGSAGYAIGGSCDFHQYLLILSHLHMYFH